MAKKKDNIDNIISKLDFTPIIANVEKVKASKAAKKKQLSTSIKPLKFDPNPNDSPLKAAIVEWINRRDLTYADIYNYCTEIKGGDIDAGQKYGYNIIHGLRNRPTMIDTTFSILCDFLKLDVILKPRETEIEEDDEEDEDA
jgi:hypothetical protein